MTRLPKKIHFPFGYVCLVKQVSDKQMKEVVEDEDGADGAWDVETRTIFIRQTLPMKRKRYVLGHELGHSFLDWQHFCLDEGAMKS
jgi:Zn-dependent peptidase ImmA (M78 family)